MNNSKLNVVIHVGYPKCASTTLQKHLFSKHTEISFLGRYPINNIGYDSDIVQPNYALPAHKIKQIHNQILNIDHSNDNNSVKNEISKILQDVDNGNTFVLSNESITSTLLDGVKVEYKAKRILDLFSDAKILIVARDPFDWMLSQYRDQPFDPKNIKESKYVSFDKWVESLFSNRKDVIESLKFDEVYTYYCNLFGSSNILLLRIEDLKNQTKEFSDTICRFLKIDNEIGFKCLNSKQENIGTSKGFTWYRRFKRVFLPLIPVNSVTISLKTKLDSLVKSLLPKKKRKVDSSLETKKKVDNFFKETIKFLDNHSL